ncbi:MAG TPA: hypothetical protein VFR59_12640, partial [Steroidobacteraceae bacterium]|nr:hypothetical protein [Steroidobacteraceae bacterium]
MSEFSADVLTRVAALFLLQILAGLLSPVAAQTTAPGTVISNVAEATFVRGASTAATASSNEVTTVVAPTGTTATMQMLRLAFGSTPPGGSGAPSAPETFGPTQCVGSAGVQTLANPVLIGGATIDPSQPRAFDATATYHGGEPVFVRVVDGDQNRDGLVRDTIDLEFRANGDVEIIRLIETSPASGVFTGYLQTRAAAASSRDCALQVTRDATVESRYVDALNPVDAVQAQALIDPTGLVFDSRTGAPVNGARVRIVDAVSGAAARVLGDDGLSVFPSEIVTGAQATDSGGTVYAFAPGTFRFPVVGVGSYRFEIVPPSSHGFPSTADAAQIAALPGAPYTINSGSYGAAFAVPAPPAANIDIPLDPAAGVLFLQKSSAVAIAAIGDFVQYTLRLENTGTGGPLETTTITDTLPRGLRYRAGSARSGEAALEPQVSADGRTLTFDAGTLAPGTAFELRYVAEVTAAARGEKLVNRALAQALAGEISNEAVATIQLRNELSRTHGFILGRIVDGGCEAMSQARGVGGVRVYLEDGRYSVTDPEGKYHFEDVPAGTHVVQLDRDTLPDTLEPALCGQSPRHTGRSFSQFVELSGGALWRADFTLTTRKPPQGSVALELNASGGADGTTVGATVEVADVAVGNMKLLAMLPPGAAYVTGSSAIEPTQTGNILSFALGERAAGSSVQLAFGVRSTTAGAPSGAVRTVLLFDSPTQNGQKLDPLEAALPAMSAPARTSAITRGVIVMLKAPRAGQAAVRTEPLPDLTQLPNVESLAPGTDWLLPVAEFNPSITSVKVALRHLPTQKIALSVNGTPVSALNFYGTTFNQARSVALSYWRGVDIPEGESELMAVVMDEQGREVSRLTRKLNYAGGPVRGELVSEGSELIADGRIRPVVRLRLTDADGELARPGTVGTF